MGELHLLLYSIALRILSNSSLYIIYVATKLTNSLNLTDKQNLLLTKYFADIAVFLNTFLFLGNHENNIIIFFIMKKSILNQE